MGAGLKSSDKGLIGSFKRCAWLLASGTALQLICGSADPSFLAHPWGLVCAIVFLYLLVVLHVLGGKFSWIKDLSSSKSSAASLAALLVLLLVFGLVRQDGRSDGLWGVLGFTKMQRSWVFIIPLLHLTALTTLNAIEDIRHFNYRRIGAALSHIAISTILVSGVFGSGDFAKVKMMARLGEPTSVAMDLDKGKPVALPFSVALDKFNYEDDGSVVKVSSDVTISVPGKSEPVRTNISVNHPAKVGSWWIYQSGYDTLRGAASEHSLLSCVRDPWIRPVTIALWMFLAAGLGMVFFGIRKK